MYVCMYLPIYLSIHLSIYQSIHLFIHLSIYLSISDLTFECPLDELFDGLLVDLLLHAANVEHVVVRERLVRPNPCLG